MIGGQRLIREIDGGSSHLSQNSVIAHFGLGSAALIDTVKARWLGGDEQILLHVEVNQQITVAENRKSTSPSWIGIYILAAIITGALVFYLKRKN